ncbi:MAG: SGNH/GDSL hydrolase family protein [Clostridia bacterium]|nr:SGNH/GDSL hydrolase family protein [Clostridia bacterium]
MINWQDFTPKTTTRARETIEWSITYSFNAPDTESPRVLLIGDSICNAYHDSVRRKLEGCANITFWASSKCVTDPDYFKELHHIVSMEHYDMICYNNGLHSLSTDTDEWSAAYRSALDMIRAMAPEAVLAVTLSTPLQDAKKTERSRALNQIALAAAEERALPVIDLFSPMDVLDRNEFWGDCYHFKAPAIDIQSDIIAACVKENLSRQGGAAHAETETGPMGKL